MVDGEVLTVAVRQIANGFLVVESRETPDLTYGRRSAPLFYPDMAGVEREFVARLRAAATIDTTSRDLGDF